MNVALQVRKELQGKNGWQLYPLFFLAAICIYFLFLTALNKVFNKDEIEHIHSAWYIIQGFVPYRDFFQHHNPLFWYLIAPVLVLTGDNPGILIFFRIIMFVLALCTATAASGIAVKVTRRLEAGLYCFILLLTSLVFIEKAIEIRPDVPMTLFCTLSGYFFIQYFDSKKSRDIILSGMLAAIAYLFLQKAIFFCAALSVFIIIMAIKKEVGIKTAVYFFLSLIAGPTLIFVYASLHGALYDYYLCGYLINVSKLHSFAPWNILKYSLIKNTGFWILASAGFLYGIYNHNKNNRLSYIAALCMVLFLSVFCIKSPWKQYYMPAMVFFSIISAFILAHVLEKVRWGTILGFIIIVVIIIKPMMSLSEYKNKQNRLQLKLIEYVITKTKADDFVYDGDNQFNLFRRDLHYFWYSTARNYNLDGYNRLTNNKYGDYNICELINQKRPRIVSDFQVYPSECMAFKMYEKVDYLNVFIMRDIP